MAEILATMVVGPLVSMVKEKASSYLLQQYNVMEGLEEQHEVLMRKLPAILDVIADAEMQAAKHREGAKAWLEAVRKVAYQANDVVDEFKYEALRRKAKKEGHYRKLGMHVIKLFPTHNRIVFRYKMGNRLRMILQAMEVLITEMNAFRFEFRPEQQVSKKWRQTESKIIGPKEIKEIASRSRAKDKQKVVDILLDQGSRVDFTVLPIVGMGGLGKTTLAQLVYNDSKIQEHFQLCLWVCVSDNFDVDFLAKSIVEAAGGSVTQGKPLLENLREVVSGKRYLLVLDDVWNRDASKWEKLKSSLQHGSTGSSVVTTTRDEAIAQHMRTVEAYKLKLLDESYIQEIIKTKAFSAKDESPADELVKMVGDMAKRCAGSPLAATALGSILCTKHNVEEWKAVLNKSNICDDETGILPILKLSYNDLPSQMRQCFSFCAMFPKDYEIDVEMLIQLWMANGFILEEQGVCPEIRGNQIFNELASRSFFQDLKEIPFLDASKIYHDYEVHRQNSKFGYCSKISCKIHDLMHDVAQSAMGKECAILATKPSKSEDFPYTTRHLFLSLDDPGMTLNGYLEERSPALQTLICTTRNKSEELRYLSKYNSLRALRMQRNPSPNPKYVHHLRYLDLSRNYSIKGLPEDITILHHLQTLNLSCCMNLSQLPKGMKYMTALRHLYVDYCPRLKMMPPKLRCLASLQTLTCFVAGTGSSCSKAEELGPLDLGGYLEVRQLENVTERHAQKANLRNKKKLTELMLEWTHPNRETQDHHHHKVLEALEPHKEIKALRIHGYSGSTYPSWMKSLQHLVELVLSECNNLEKLPQQLLLPNLRVLRMSRMKNVQCLCGGDPTFRFNNLKELNLFEMPNLETWWDINEVRGKEPIFSKVEMLIIRDCGKLTALPRAAVITGDDIGQGSAFPALEELQLSNLTSFQRWEAVEGIVGEQITTFPRLRNLSIVRCPELTTPPKALKLSVLEIVKGGHDFLLPHSSTLTLWNCMVQLENLDITNCDVLVHWPENVFQCLVLLRKLFISGCNNLTGHTQASEQSTPGRSVFPPCLESLSIRYCDSLVEVPIPPASLKDLYISWCEKLESVALPPCLESLYLWWCGSLVEVPILPESLTKLEVLGCKKLESVPLPSRLESLYLSCSLVDIPVLPASLRELYISGCEKIESIVLRKQPTETLASGDCVLARPEKSALIRDSCSEAAPNMTSSNGGYLPCQVPSPSPSITNLKIWSCTNLRSISVQLDCAELDISNCSRLKSLGDLPSLEHLDIQGCKDLDSIPDVPQAYTSLRYLVIRGCPRLKVLPPCLNQQLDCIEDTSDLDACYTGPKLSRPSTWKYVITRHC